MSDVTLASSHDDGESFHNERLSSRSFDSRVGTKPTPQLPVDFGSRLGLASSDEHPSVAAWTDTRRGSLETGRQDIFAATYEVANPAGPLSRLPVIAALLMLALLSGGLAIGARQTRS